MAFKVTLVDEIAKLHGWEGTRRRTCTFQNGEVKTLVFSRKPVLLDELPPEVAADEKLVVQEIESGPRAVPAADSQPGQAASSTAPADAPPPPAPADAAPALVVPATSLPEGYEEFELEDLRKLAAARGLDITGNRYQVRNRLRDAAAAPAAPAESESEVA